MTDAEHVQRTTPSLKLVPASPTPPEGEAKANAVRATAASTAHTEPEQSQPSLHVVGLLVVDHDSETFANLRSARGAHEIYIRCAAVMAKSAHAAGYPVTIYTNDRALIRERFDALGVDGPVRIEQRTFVSRLDRSIQHRSAHHKLDVIRDLARGEDDVVSMLVDLDAVFVRPLRPSELPNVRQIGCYDITAMMRSESAGRCDDDIRNLTLRAHDLAPRWFGGEALAARADKFREIVGYLDEVEPRYWQLTDRLYHTGDEAPVSSALNLYLAKGGAISEMGDRRVIARWWTASRSFRQPDFSALSDRAILHLPADKEFIASLATAPFQPTAFIAAYRRYARAKLFGRRIKSFVLTHIMKRPPSYAARA